MSQLSIQGPLIGYEINSLSDAIKVLNILYNEGDFNAARCAIKIAFDFAQKLREHPSKPDLKKLCGIAGDVYGELGIEDIALNHYAKLHFFQMQLNNNIFDGGNFKDTFKLFQFRRFTEYSLSNLLHREITLTSPSQMNDIVDTPVFSWLNSPTFGQTSLHKGHLRFWKKSFDDYRIASFCINNPSKRQYAVKNTLMWSHYADNHSGFCVEYEFHSDDFRKDNIDECSAARLMKIKYINPKKNPLNFDPAPKSITTEQGFMTKSKDWEYENEVRIIQYKPTGGTLREQYILDPQTKIVAIYFGYRCTQTNIEIIKKLLEGENIKYYKMDIDYTNIHRLKYTKI